MSEALLKSNATDEQTRSALQKFENIFGSYENHITSLVQAKGLDPRNFMVTVINSFKRNPTLLECEISTVLGAVLASAELGLEPNTPFQLSHIIPYNNKKGDNQWVKEAQFQIGYQGWIELFSRHPKISHVDFQLVHANDEFKQIMGAKPELIHIPCLDPSKKGDRIGAYAIAWMKGVEQPIWAFVHATEVMQIKTKSKGSDSKFSPWQEENDPMGWMWKKVAIKQLAKKLPKTREIELSIYAEDAVETGKSLKADTENKTIKLDPLESQEEKNQARAEEQSQKVAEATASMFNKKKEDEPKNETGGIDQRNHEPEIQDVREPSEARDINSENNGSGESDNKPDEQGSNGSDEAKGPEKQVDPEADLPDRRKKAIYYFDSLGIKKDRLLAKLELSHEDEISLDHLIILDDLRAEVKAGKAINELIPPVKSN